MPNTTIDIQAILNSMKSVLMGAVTSNLPAVTSAVSGYIVDAEIRLADLAEGAMSGQLSYKEVMKSLQEEPTNIKNQLLSIAEIVGADLQDLANKAVSIFTAALNDAIAKLP